MDNNSEEQQKQILENIAKLQQMEKDLYKELESSEQMSSSSSQNATGKNWRRIGTQNTTVTVPPNTPVRYGQTDKWVESIKSGTFLINDVTMGGDPVVGELKWVEAYLPVEKSVTQTDSGKTDAIINRINQLSQIRISLFKSLDYTYKSLQKNVNTSRSELVELLTIVSIVEEELNNAKAQLTQLYDIKNGKMRMVEINTYYGKKYKAQSSLMKLIIFVFVILLVLAILNKKGFIPDNISNILLAVVIVFGAFFIIRRIYDITRRDNMNFDAYNWKFNPDEQIPTVYEYDKAKLKGLVGDVTDTVDSYQFNGLDCIGTNCCSDGMTYDTKAKKCIKNSAPESFVTGQLTKHCFNRKPQFANSPNNYPAPYGSEETINFARV